jgi:hypothetical protein
MFALPCPMERTLRVASTTLRRGDPLNPVNRLVGHAVLVTSVFVGVSALVLGGASLLGARPAWALFGFEVVTVVAAALGIFYGFGKFRQSPGMALACIGGTIFVAGVLGWMSVTASAGQSRQVGGIPLTPMAAFRVLASMIVLLGGAVVVLSRRPGAWKPAVVGAMLGAPVGLGLLLFAYPGTRGMVAGAVFGSTVGAVAAFLVVAALLSASVHLLIRGFEIGAEEEPPTSRKA